MEEEQGNFTQGETPPESSLKKQFTTVTPFSKYLAMALFVALPFIGLLIGFNYGKSVVISHDVVVVEYAYEGVDKETSEVLGGNEKTEVAENYPCDFSDDYIVFETGRVTFIVKENPIVFPENMESCEYIAEINDYEIVEAVGHGWENIERVYKKYLIIESGTGPDLRFLAVYDLSVREVVFKTLYAKPHSFWGNGLLSYWEPIDKEVTEENCPRQVEWKDNFGSRFQEFVTLDLNSLELDRSGAITCHPEQ